MFDSLFQEISKTIQLDVNDKTFCRQYFETVSVNRNTIIEEQKKFHYFYILLIQDLCGCFITMKTEMK